MTLFIDMLSRQVFCTLYGYNFGNLSGYTKFRHTQCGYTFYHINTYPSGIQSWPKCIPFMDTIYSKNIFFSCIIKSLFHNTYTKKIHVMYLFNTLLDNVMKRCTLISFLVPFSIFPPIPYSL